MSRLMAPVTAMARQINLDGGALAQLAVDFHVPGRLPDEAIHLAQPEAGSPADFLCGEEGLERLVERCLFHP